MLRIFGLLAVAGLFLFVWIEFILKLLNLKGTGDELGGIAFVIFCDLAGALLIIAFRSIKTKRREQRILRSAAAWLRNRERGRNNRRPMRSRGLLVIPSVLALLFFFFEPETIGIWEHVIGWGRIRVGRYLVSTPVTWITYAVPDRDSPDEQWVLNAKGAARMEHHRYWPRIGQVIWSIAFSTQNTLDPHPLQARRFPEVLSKETTAIAGYIPVNCEQLQYLGRYVHSVRIACSVAEKNLYVHADGDLRKLNVFYEFLQHNVRQDAGRSNF